MPRKNRARKKAGAKRKARAKKSAGAKRKVRAKKKAGAKKKKKKARAKKTRRTPTARITTRARRTTPASPRRARAARPAAATPAETGSDLRVRLPKPLRGFRDADTSSELEGRLQAGTYAVLERRTGEAGGDADYARVSAPAMPGGDTWICTRWRSESYGELFEFTPRPAPAASDWSADDLSVPESELIDTLEAFHGYSYTSKNARYPFALDGVSLKQAPPGQNNCCTFVEALVVRTWQNVHGIPWDSHLHNLMMIISDDLFGPITAIEKAGMGVRVPDPDAPPQPWTAIQGWTEGNGSGHAFFILDYDEATDRVLTLESNKGYGLNGVGFRMLGNIEAQPNARPPAAWPSIGSMPTWEQICSRYVSRACATLKVTDIGWARGS